MDRLEDEGAFLEDSAALSKQINDASARIQSLNKAKQELAAKKQQRLQVAATAYLECEEVDLDAMDADITLRERALPAQEREVEMLNTVLSTLNERQNQQQQLAAALRLGGLRNRMQELDKALESFAPAYGEATNALQRIIIEMVAVGMARNRLAPKIPGTSQIAMEAQFQIPAPLLPAFKGMGGWFNVDAEAKARMKEILADLGVMA